MRIIYSLDFVGVISLSETVSTIYICTALITDRQSLNRHADKGGHVKKF